MVDRTVDPSVDGTTYERVKDRVVEGARSGRDCTLHTFVRVSREWQRCPVGRAAEFSDGAFFDLEVKDPSGSFAPTLQHHRIKYDVWDKPGYRQVWNKCDHVSKVATYDGEPRLIATLARPDTLMDTGKLGCGDTGYSHIRMKYFGDLQLGLPPEILTEEYIRGTTPILGKGDPVLTRQREIHRTQAWQSFVPRMVSGFSLPRFIGELKDCRGMLRNIGDWLPRLRNRGAGRLPRGLRNLLRRPGAEVANAHLSACFGWAPFLRDVHTIVDLYLSLDKKIDDYIRGLNKKKTLHYRHGINPSLFNGALDSDIGGSITLTSDSFLEPLWFCRDGVKSVLLYYIDRDELSDCRYHATMDFTARLPLAWTMRSLLRDMTWGFQRGTIISLRDAWNLVPFSFILDWIYPIDRFLGSLQYLEELPVTVDIYNYCESFKYHLERTRNWQAADCFIETTTAANFGPWQVLPQSIRPKMIEDGYYRYLWPRPGAPGPRPFEGTISGLNGTQISFVWALSHQRVFH